MQYDLGLIGLATMGANLARNIADKKIKTLVYNRTAEKTQEFLKQFGNEYLQGKEELKDFVEALNAPRKIILLVKAGEPVDEIINQLMPLLETGDSIIDCGNSNYGDTIRRANELKKRDIHFVGCGISGGEEGALHGPSLMPGGSDESWRMMKDVWEKIAAKDFQGNPCVTHVGENGAGHYVKMVHNGIEYAVMQVMSEAYDLLRKLYEFDAEKIADVFEQLGKGKLESYLFEIAVPVLRKKEEGKHLIDFILDKAGQKGTGKWTAIEGLDRAVGVSSISEAVFARVNSGEKDLRKKLSSQFPKSHLRTKLSLEEFTKKLEQALYASMLSIYAQGFELIKKAASENTWKINLSEISRIWQGGCIIRARILKFLTEMYRKSNDQSHLFEVPEIQNSINETSQDWRDIISLSVYHGIPTPSITTALQYVDTLSSEQLPANLIQGMRDYFGAHTYERTDRSGNFHTKWEE